MVDFQEVWNIEKRNRERERVEAWVAPDIENEPIVRDLHT